MLIAPPGHVNSLLTRTEGNYRRALPNFPVSFHPPHPLAIKTFGFGLTAALARQILDRLLNSRIANDRQLP